MNTLKALFAISLPVFILGAIFEASVLKAYIGSKKLEQAKLARMVTRAPAVLAKN